MDIFCLKCIAPYGLDRYGSVQHVEENCLCSAILVPTMTAYNCFFGGVQKSAMYIFQRPDDCFSFQFLQISVITNTMLESFVMEIGRLEFFRRMLLLGTFPFHDTFITTFLIYLFLIIPVFTLPERCDCLMLCQGILHKTTDSIFIIFCTKRVQI